MTAIAPQVQETNLVGTIVNAAMSDVATTVQVKFIDLKTGEAREPNAATKLFTFDKDTLS